MIKRFIFFYFFILPFLGGYHLIAIDNPHFYRANFFWGEPRFEEPWLTSFDISLGGGGTKTARDRDGHKTPLLNIYGLHVMRLLGENVPLLDPDNNLDQILIALAQIPARDNFGNLKFRGDFSCIESVLNFYQNLSNGFFLQWYLPFRRLGINTIRFRDLSPNDDIFPNKNTPEWVAFLDNFSAILARYDLMIKDAHESGAGDFSFLVGWTCNYQDTCYHDFFDVNAKVGILFPTGKRRTLHNPFDLPLGYNGFFGLPFKFDCSAGYWEWLTAGFHIGALFLFEKTKTLAMKTAAGQNGFIMLTDGKAKVDSGTLWDISCYLKADHFFKGLSLLCGYCYTLKDNDCIDPLNKEVFNPIIINADPLYRSWRMHVIHWIAEFDFAKKLSDWGPRVSLFYNWIIDGERIFDTSMLNASLGIDVSWVY